MNAFDELPAIRPQRLFEGILARAVHGERITLAVVELDGGAVVPEHSHENEQLGMVLEGSVSFRVADEERVLGPGGTWRIKSRTPHVVQAGPGGAVVIDVFTPRRDDWHTDHGLEVQQPRWP